MTVLSPAEVCKELGIQDSTLRKYSLLLDKEGVSFERYKNNRRKYTETHVITLKRTLELMHNDDMTLETAIKQACKELKANPVIEEKTVSEVPLQRNNDDATALLIKEIREMKQQLTDQEKRQKERDLMFVEALEELQGEIRELKNQQQLLTSPKDDGVDTMDNIENGGVNTEPLEDDLVKHDTIKKKGFFAKLFNKD